jgi:hypothetical protein
MSFSIPITPAPAAYSEWQGDSETHQKDANTVVIGLALAGADRTKSIWAIYAVYNNGTDSYTKWAYGDNSFNYVISDWASIPFTFP